MQTLLSSLKANSINEIGTLNIDELGANLALVKYDTVESTLITQGRTGHRYDVPTKTVYIARDSFGHQDDLDSFINLSVLVHESIGAAGYYDENYEISSTILSIYLVLNDKNTTSIEKNSLLGKINSFKLNSAVRTSNPTVTRNTSRNETYVSDDGFFSTATRVQFASSGGVTEGGGGGDPVAAYIKSYLLFTFLKTNVSITKVNKLINEVTFETYVNKGNETIVYCSKNKDAQVKKIDNILVINFPYACAFEKDFVLDLKDKVLGLIK